MKNKTAIFTVFYPKAELYIPEFMQSLANQSDTDFILFVVNDGIQNINRFFNKCTFPVKSLNAIGTPAALRKKGIQWTVSEGAESIIFADADDYFAENRVEISKQVLRYFDAVFNELLMVGEAFSKPVPMFGETFKDKQEITVKDIVTGNCMGLGNSAIKVTKITPLLSKIPDDIIAFDWCFFALCLHGGAKVAYSKNTRTYYRQYNGNIAPPSSFTDDQILRGVQIKRDHYHFIAKHYGDYKKLALKLKEIDKKINSDAYFKNKYCSAVRLRSSNTKLWWESIKVLEELGL